MSRHAGLAGATVDPVAPAEPRSAYRTRAKLMVAPGARIGIFGVVGDHEVVDTPGCIVLSPALDRVLAELRPMVKRDDVAGGPAPLAPAPHRGGAGLVALDLREVCGPATPGSAESASRVLVTFVVTRGPGFRLEGLRAAALELSAASPEVAGVAVNFNDGTSPQVLGDETLLLAGQRSLLDTLGGSTHRATFGSFVQAHRGQAARLHSVVSQAVLRGVPAGQRPRVLDLYGGSGAIALTLAVQGADVLLVESFGPAVEQAVASARDAQVPLRTERADVAAALGRMVRSRDEPSIDVAVVNPPRRGLDPIVRAHLAALPIDTVVYVSCQPETLARDLAHLARLGLAVDTLAPLDMIPLTEEVETVAVLRRREPLAPVVLYEDADVLAVDKPPHEPTTPQSEHPHSLLARVQRLRGAEEAVAVHRLDVGTSGVVLFARTASKAGAWSAALQADDGEKSYVAAVRGLTDARGTVDRALLIDGKSKRASTRYGLSRAVAGHSIVDVFPDEGRTHQIRRHLAAIGHPVLGDDRYGHAPTNRFLRERHGLDRTFLHARRVELTHPSTGKRLVIDAPLPGDLAQVVHSLETSRLAPGRIDR